MLNFFLLCDIRQKTGMHGFNLRSVGRDWATLLNKSDMTSVDAQTAIGHRKALQRTSTIIRPDAHKSILQGLMVTGNQSQSKAKEV